MIKFSKEEKEVLQMIGIKTKKFYSKKELIDIYVTLEDNVMNVGLGYDNEMNETGEVMTDMLNKLGQAGYYIT